MPLPTRSGLATTANDRQMASEFDLQEEPQALQDSGDYSIEHENYIRSMQPGEMDALLQRVS
jgi:hypothetical protein